MSLSYDSMLLDRLSTRRFLEDSYAQAKIALGKRMYALGIDDGVSGAMIRSVELTMAQRRTLGEDCGGLRRRRLRLFMQLAEEALRDDAPLPGADDEWEQAFAAREALGQTNG